MDNIKTIGLTTVLLNFTTLATDGGKSSTVSGSNTPVYNLVVDKRQVYERIIILIIDLVLIMAKFTAIKSLLLHIRRVY